MRITEAKRLHRTALAPTALRAGESDLVEFQNGLEVHAIEVCAFREEPGVAVEKATLHSHVGVVRIHVRDITTRRLSVDIECAARNARLRSVLPKGNGGAMKWKWVRSFVVLAAAAALVSAAAIARPASAKTPVPPLDGVMVITGLGDLCPGFAPFIPGDPVADDGTVWFASNPITFDPGEYLWFGSVDSNSAGVLRTSGAGVPPGYPGWMPTSDHTYKLTGHVTDQSEIFDFARLTVVRDDGARVTGDAQIQVDMNHGVLATTWISPPSCRLR